MDGARLRAELHFHDDQAAQRAKTFAQNPELLTVADDAYLDHESWVRPALARLGPLAGLRVLDFGCGHAMAAVVMARQGAEVTAFDLSRGYLAEADQRAAHNGVGIRFVQADGNRLPFESRSFDRVWGNAILHHLDLKQAGAEIARILKPDGRAVFCEPWGENWLLRVARNRLGYAAKHRTEDEEPLRRRDLDSLAHWFGEVELEGYQLLAMASRFLGRNKSFAALERWDRFILGRIPRLRKYCRYVVLTLERPRRAEIEIVSSSQDRRNEPARSNPVACQSES